MTESDRRRFGKTYYFLLIYPEDESTAFHRNINIYQVIGLYISEDSAVGTSDFAKKLTCDADGPKVTSGFLNTEVESSTPLGS
jgi:hypothetical protein